MRKALRIVGWVIGVLVLVPIVAVLAAVLLLNIDPGRRLVERLAGQFTRGQVQIAGLAGRFPDALRLAHAEIHDAQGPWLTLDDVVLDWSPLALLHGEARVDLLSAGRIQVTRLPVASPAPAKPEPANNAPFTLPVRVSVEALHVHRAEIGAPVAGVAAALALDGSAHVTSLQDGAAEVTIDRLDSAGSYQVQGRIDPSHVSAKLQVAEPPKGLIASIAKLPDIGAIRLNASVEGPRSAEIAALDLSAGPLRATAKGTVDLAGRVGRPGHRRERPGDDPGPRRPPGSPWCWVPNCTARSPSRTRRERCACPTWRPAARRSPPWRRTCPQCRRRRAPRHDRRAAHPGAEARPVRRRAGHPAGERPAG